jgi:hypothetical protein
LFRQICESYQGLTPADLEDLTADQLYILCAKKSDLARLGGAATVSVDEAREIGIIQHSANPTSLVQRVRAQKQAEREAEKKLSKRHRRREFDRQLKERRARGEKI